MRLPLPIRINSLPSGERSNDVKLINPVSDTCCHVPSGSASRYNLLSAAMSEFAYNHLPSGEKRTVPPIGAVCVGPRPPASVGSRTPLPVSALTSESCRTPFSMRATTRVLPSGDQSFAQPSQILCSAPPSDGITYTADLNPATASLKRLKAIRRPSGEKIGPVSKSGCVVSRSGSPESISFT